MAARTALSCPHDALRGITRQLLALEVGSMSVAARSFATSSRRREEAASAAAVAGEQSPTASTSSASASKPDFAAILNGPASSSSTPDRQIVDFPTSTTSFRPQRSRSAGQSNRSPYSPSRLHPVAPYRLHAHCTKHNTILSLTKDLPDELQKYLENKNVEGAFNAMQSGKGVSEDSIDPKILGQTVLRVSPGLLGLKKAQRGTFEAASRASVQMFNLIAQLGTKDRTNKKGQKVRDLRPSSIELVLKGFGPGREALVAALNSAQGDQVRQKISRITDATPIKIGGTRPKKRRKLSPPLDLGRRRR